MNRNLETEEWAAANTCLAQWGLTSLTESLGFYCKFVLADNLVFSNPPLPQAWERYAQCRGTDLVFRTLALLHDARSYAKPKQAKEPTTVTTEIVIKK